jgi:AbrB family looped-hinge helix DNA binding protein
MGGASCGRPYDAGMKEVPRAAMSDSVTKEVPQEVRMWQTEADMAEDAAFVRLRLGPQGRVVLPAHFRRALGLEVGDPLVASIEDGRLVLAPREAARASLVARFPVRAGGSSAVDELLEQRRAEARRETADTVGAREPT